MPNLDFISDGSYYNGLSELEFYVRYKFDELGQNRSKKEMMT